MNKLFKMLLCSVVLGLCINGIALSQTINAASCSATDVQTALSSVTASTTTVNIPSCSATPWTSAVSFTVPSGNTSLTIQGQTTCTGSGDPSQNNLSCTDNTTIVDNYASSNTLISITTNSNTAAFFRITGLTIKGGSGQIKYGIIQLYGFSQNIRIDHNDFNTSTYSPAVGSDTFRIHNPLYGVMDHNLFNGTVSPFQEAVNVYNGDSPNGDAAWAAASNLGQSNFLFIESSTFNNFGSVNDCFTGGRAVIRYNTLVNTNIQTHPTGGAGDWRGCRALEFYKNNLSITNSTPQYNAYFLSSGTGVIWGNTAPAPNFYEAFISLHSMRRNNQTYNESVTPVGWGYCGTVAATGGNNAGGCSVSGPCSAWDQNTNTNTGYRCLDQPGQGRGQLLVNQFSPYPPGKLNNSTGTIAWPNEALEPIYEWMDSWTEAAGYSSGFLLNTDSTALVNNLDYYLWCNASSPTGCASFTGSTGVGSGAFASAPVSCTKGVGYWATDQQELYVCGSSNNWVFYYAPYTYPHPLEGGLVPPTNVTATAY